MRADEAGRGAIEPGEDGCSSFEGCFEYLTSQSAMSAAGSARVAKGKTTPQKSRGSKVNASISPKFDDVEIRTVGRVLGNDGCTDCFAPDVALSQPSGLKARGRSSASSLYILGLA
jgi:hypothetical protein